MVRCRNLTKVLILAFLFRQLSQAGHGALLGVKSGWKWWPKPHHEPQPPPPAEEPHHTPDGQHEESIFEEFVDEVRLCPWLLFAEISTVVVLGALFEQLQHWVREHLDHSGDKVGMQIMDVLFREFSGLGFIGMFLFLVTQSHITADVLGKKVFGHHLDKMGTEDPIAESFETVHMMIFLLMAVLLFQAMAMLRVTQGVIETWGRYERCRSWGLRQDSLESLFCDGGYLERVASKTAPRGLELKFREDFTYQEPFLQWMMLHHDRLSTYMLMKQYDASTLNAELKFGAPGLQGLEAQEVELGKPPVSDPKRLRLTSSRYAFLFELLAFWQAIQVTCLVLYYLTVSFDNWHSVLFYALAWAEWPLMLFGVMPVLLERLTLRSSIGEETDENLATMVSLETKAMMLRYHVRLAQLKGFEERQERQEHQERQHQEKRSALSVPAAEEGRVTKTLKSPVRVAARAVRLFRHSPAQVRAEITWQRGLRVFRSLPYSEQFEIEQIFSSLDINNNEEVMLQDLAAHWKAMGFSHAMDSAEKLLASIDYDGSGQLTWSKFQAVAALATSVKGDEEDEDYRLLFRLIDRNQDGRRSRPTTDSTVLHNSPMESTMQDYGLRNCQLVGRHEEWHDRSGCG
eukprot:g33319.t1